MTIHADEIIPNGIVFDGDIHPRDDDPDLKPDNEWDSEANRFIKHDAAGNVISAAEQRRAEAVIEAMNLVQASKEFATLARKGHTDSDVKRFGGVNACKQLAHDKMIQARKTYIEALGFTYEKPDEDDSAAQDSYDEGSLQWISFKKTIDDPDARSDLRAQLERAV
jgi:hypothetical protein